MLGGGAGGKPELAISGGPRAEKIDEAIEAVASAARSALDFVIVGVDPGQRRVGIAVADDETRFARPLEVIDSQKRDPVDRIVEIVQEVSATTVVVGRPVSLSGRAGPAVEAQQSFVERLRSSVSVNVEEFDERLTTVSAERRLREAGTTGARAKAVKDTVAAQLMLQDYLDARS